MNRTEHTSADSIPLIERVGHFFFRTRNVLFPALLVILILLFQPQSFLGRDSIALTAMGLAAMLLGQAIRVVTIGLDYVKRGGKRKRVYADRLVTGGFYAHSRNPMYAGNILIALGLLLLIGNPWAILFGGLFTLFAYHAITRSEEVYLTERFGDTYRAYVARTPRCLPRLRGLIVTLRSYHFDWRGVVVKEYSTLFTTAMLATLVLAWKAWRSNLIEPWAPELIAAGSLWIVLFYIARFLKKRTGWRARGVTASEASLRQRRRRIDLFDAAILDLLNQRAIEVSAIFDWKRLRGIERVDPARMDEMLDRLVSLNSGPLTEHEVRNIFTRLIHHFAFHYEAGEARGEHEESESSVVTITGAPVAAVIA